MSLRPNYHFWPHRGNRLQTAPALEPIDVDQLRVHLREPPVDDYDYWASLISEARQFIEDSTNIALINQTWLLTYDQWPGYMEPWWDGVREGHVNMLYGGRPRADLSPPRYPLSSVTSITVYDEASNSTVVNVGATFDVDTNSIPGRISLKSGSTWPIATRANNAIEIVYVAGYGTTPEDVPAPLRRAVLQMAAYLYTARGDGCSPAEAFVKSGAQGLLRAYRPAAI